MIRKIENKDIDKTMDIWLESTIKAHDFIPKECWEDNYNTVKDVYIPIAETFVYEDSGYNEFIKLMTLNIFSN